MEIILVIAASAVVGFALGRARRRSTGLTPPKKEMVREGGHYWLPPIPVPIIITEVASDVFWYRRVDRARNAPDSRPRCKRSDVRLRPADLAAWQEEEAAKKEAWQEEEAAKKEAWQEEEAAKKEVAALMVVR
jgi:hypothetical protein